jgi:hypothetical protein
VRFREGVEEQFFLVIPNFEFRVRGISYAEKDAVVAGAVAQEQSSFGVLTISEGSDVTGVSVLDKQASKIVFIFDS